MFMEKQHRTTFVLQFISTMVTYFETLLLYFFMTFFLFTLRQQWVDFHMKAFIPKPLDILHV